MKRLISLLFITGFSCTTIPEGSLELRKRLQEDSLNREYREDRKFIPGESIYIKAFSYPKALSDGDFLNAGSILLRIGHHNKGPKDRLPSLGLGH